MEGNAKIHLTWGSYVLLIAMNGVDSPEYLQVDLFFSKMETPQIKNSVRRGHPKTCLRCGTLELELHLLKAKKYYELGPDDPPYAAKFYDCCGAEDPEAAGCTTSFHVSYDDD
ncbi:hypothetical protein RJ641_007912 [Dillenia turbinata]|uniref:Uncharacterized protein n=1 Tax=Dillenia turbinata TaxID=194707 RepID=A0AAN8ZA99_9MAGN